MVLLPFLYSKGSHLDDIPPSEQWRLDGLLYLDLNHLENLLPLITQKSLPPIPKFSEESWVMREILKSQWRIFTGWKGVLRRYSFCFWTSLSISDQKYLGLNEVIFHSDTDGAGGHHPKWSNSETENQLSHVLTRKWKLNNGYTWTYRGKEQTPGTPKERG